VAEEVMDFEDLELDDLTLLLLDEEDT